jgi:hypothetical protein
VDVEVVRGPALVDGDVRDRRRQRLPQLVEEVLVTAQQRRRFGFREVPSQARQIGQIEPGRAELIEVDPEHLRRRHQRGVEAAGTCPGHDIDTHGTYAGESEQRLPEPVGLTGSAKRTVS